MKEKEYNIYFAIGDFSNDGHGQSKDFHLVSNYSVQEITNSKNIKKPDYLKKLLKNL